jgi:hypothetical protein
LAVSIDIDLEIIVAFRCWFHHSQNKKRNLVADVVLVSRALATAVAFRLYNPEWKIPQDVILLLLFRAVDFNRIIPHNNVYSWEFCLKYLRDLIDLDGVSSLFVFLQLLRNFI